MVRLGRGLGLGVVGRRLFELRRQFQVLPGEFARPLLGIRVLECLGFERDFFGACSRVPPGIADLASARR
jgi:hypothetical protein